MGSSTDISSILDNAAGLISAISHTSGFTVRQIPEWYEPSDKYINKNVLNISIPKFNFTKELKLEKDTNGNTIIGNTIIGNTIIGNTIIGNTIVI
jgi:hypothetical protein